MNGALTGTRPSLRDRCTQRLLPPFAVAMREFHSAFVTSTGWMVLAIAGVVASVTFCASTFAEGGPSTLRVPLIAAGWALIVTAPALSMRTIAEEYRQKTWESLFASPISSFDIVKGKVFACGALVCTLLLPSALLVVPLEFYSDPDYGELACGIFGLWLSATAACSLGVFLSSTTASQVVAYLCTLFAWFALAVGSRMLVGVVPLEWARVVASLDPLARLETFTIGLFDSAAVAYFLSIIFVATIGASVRLERLRVRVGKTAAARVLDRVEMVSFVASSVVLAISCVYFASQPRFRLELDLTKTRAYSLAPSTISMLESLPAGAWEIVLFVEDANVDRAVLRQVDEVLHRMHEVNPRLTTRRINPTDPAQGGEYESALSEIVARNSTSMDAYRAAIDDGLSTFDQFRRGAGSQSTAIRAAIRTLDAQHPARRAGEQMAAFFAQIASEGERFQARIAEFLTTSAARPLPELDSARSALSAAFKAWGDQLAGAASILDQWRGVAGMPEGSRSFGQTKSREYDELAMRLLTVREQLEALPSLEIDALTKALLAGEVAVVLAPEASAVIPAWQLFPKASKRTADNEVVAFNWGFRGEEVLASSLRTLAGAKMPEVVFVHAEPSTLLKSSTDRSDLVAMADALRASGSRVIEWMPHLGKRPVAESGVTQVFVIQPPLRRKSLEPSAAEASLIATTESLLEGGDRVLITEGRSLLSLLGQPDPWSTMLEGMGIRARTGKVIFELVAREDGTPEAQAYQLIERFPRAMPFASRMQGRAMLLPQPMPLELDVARAEDAHVRCMTAIELEPLATRWIEDDWRNEGAGVQEVSAKKRMESVLPLALLLERRQSGAEGGDAQRVVIVGSGGWMLSSVADISQSLGGSRVLLTNPGNREFLLASVAWLANREDLLGTGMSGREIARIEGLSDEARLVWRVVLLGLMPCAPLVAGACVMLRRRRGGR